MNVACRPEPEPPASGPGRGAIWQTPPMQKGSIDALVTGERVTGVAAYKS